MKQVLLLSAIALSTLSGCFSYSQSNAPIWQDAPNYSAMKSAMPPARAYIYGNGTVLEFPKGGTPAWIRIKDSAGWNVPFEQVGRFIRIPHRLPEFTAWINGVPRDFMVAGGGAPMVLARERSSSSQAEQGWIENSPTEQDGGRSCSSGDEAMAQRISALEAQIARMRMEVPTVSAHAAEVAPDKPMKPLEAKVTAARSEDPPAPARVQVAIASPDLGAKPMSDAMKPLEAKAHPAPVDASPATAHNAATSSPNRSADDTAKAAALQQESWAITNEKTLREVVNKWATQAGVLVRWESTRDLPMRDSERSVSFDGDFRAALSQLAGKFSFVDKPLGIRFLENGKVLKVYDLPNRS